MLSTTIADATCSTMTLAVELPVEFPVITCLLLLTGLLALLPRHFVSMTKTVRAKMGKNCSIPKQKDLLQIRGRKDNRAESGTRKQQKELEAERKDSLAPPVVRLQTGAYEAMSQLSSQLTRADHANME